MKFNYHTYKSERFTCPKCNWSGLGSEAFLSDLSEIHTLRDVECPKCDETLHTFDLAEPIEPQEKLQDPGELA
jgi:transcription initiation factor IIE alpha subunit